MLKKSLAVLVASAMIVSLIPFQPSMAAEPGGPGGEELVINIGDYVLMGTYNEEPILWRCVDKDANGPLMLSDKILTFKAFAARASYPTYPTYADGTNQRDDLNYFTRVPWDAPMGFLPHQRAVDGSNIWETSALRSWLNSEATAGNVIWLDNCPPASGKLLPPKYSYKEPYDNEKGFLSDGNFTETERGFIKTVVQKSVLHYYDVPKLKVGGNQHFEMNSLSSGNLFHPSGPAWPTTPPGEPPEAWDHLRTVTPSSAMTPVSTLVSNFDSYYYHNVTDRMFCLDLKQQYRVLQNAINLGSDYTTAAYATQSLIDDFRLPDSGALYDYWLRTPATIYITNLAYDDARNGGFVLKSNIDTYNLNLTTTIEGYSGDVPIIAHWRQFNGHETACRGNGVRPAFYLDTAKAAVETGTGNKANPYILAEKPASKLTVRVMDNGTGQVIPGATVTIGANNKVTGMDGTVEFDISNMADYTIRVIKEEYNEYENTIHISSEEQTEEVYLKQGLTIDSVKVALPDGGERELMVDSGFIVDNEDEEAYTLTAKVDWNNKEGKTGTVALVGAKSKKRIPFDQNGKLTGKIGKEFQKGEKIYVEATREDTGEVEAEMLYAEMEKIAQVVREGAASYKIPTVGGPKVDDDIPILGGTTFSLDIDKLSNSVSVSIKDRKVIIKIGSGRTLQESNFSRGLNRGPKFTKKFGLIGSTKAELEIFGRFEIPIDILKEESEFSGSVGIALGSKGKGKLINIAEIQNQLVIGPVPVVIKVKFSAGFEAEGGVSATKWNFSDAKPSLSITPSGALRVSAGVGLAKAANVCAYGQGELQAQITIISKEPGGNTLNPSLTLSFGVELEVGPFEYEKQLGDLAFPKKTAGGLALQDFNMDLQDLDTNQFKMIGRRYLENAPPDAGFVPSEIAALSEAGINLLSEDEPPARYTVTVEDNAFPNTFSKPLIIGDDVHLLYQQDDQNRLGADGLKLVSVKQSGTDFLKASAVVVDDDGTLDGNFDAASHGGDTFVVWENSKAAFNSNVVSFGQYASSIEICASKYDNDTGEWGAPLTFTDNTYADHSPVIAVRNGKAVIAWLSNSASDILGTAGINNIHYAIYADGAWGDIKTMENVGLVTSIDVGWGRGLEWDTGPDTAYLCFDKDEDRNLNTPDGAVYLMNLTAEGRVPQKFSTDGNSKGGQFFNEFGFNGLRVAYMNDEGNIKYTGLLFESESGQEILDYGVGNIVETGQVEGYGLKILDSDSVNADPNDNYDPAYSGFMWLETSKEGGYNGLCASYHFREPGGIETDKKLSLPGQGGSYGHNIKNFNAVIDADGRVFISYLEDPHPQIINAETGYVVRGARKLKVYSYPMKSLADSVFQIVPGSISWDEEAYAKGEDVPFTFEIENISERNYNINGFDVKFYSNNTLLHSQCLDQIGGYSFDHRKPLTVETLLPAGLISGRQNIDVSITLPYSDTVSFTDKERVIIGYPLLSVKEVYTEKVRGRYYLNSTIENTGAIPANYFVIEVCEDSPGGDVIYSQTVDALEPLGKSYIRYPIDEASVGFNGPIKEYYVNVRPLVENDFSLAIQTASMLGVLENPEYQEELPPFEIFVADGTLSESGVFTTRIFVQNNTSADASPILVTALYDADGRMAAIAHRNIAVPLGQSKYETFSLTVDNILGEYTQKVFLLNNLSDIKPLVEEYD